MKKIRNIMKPSLNLLCSFLIALSPLLIEATGCFLVWGEPECPDTLKDLYSPK